MTLRRNGNVVEYALIAALVGVAIVAGATALAKAVQTHLQDDSIGITDSDRVGMIIQIESTDSATVAQAAVQDAAAAGDEMLALVARIESGEALKAGLADGDRDAVRE